MPSGKPINWEQYDDLFNSHLPSMTIEQFTQQFLSHISSKAVGARARKLGIKPAAKHLTDEQIQHHRDDTHVAPNSFCQEDR